MITSEKIDSLDKNATICFLSADVQFLIKSLKKNIVSVEDKEILALISKKVRLIQHKAQKMEKRLQKYRSSIENLGFTRN